MLLIGVDCESHLIKPGLLAPKLVCVSWASAEGKGLLSSADGIIAVRGWLRDPNVHLAIHNATYDLGVFCAEDPTLLPLVFQAYSDGRIHCTMIRQKLYDIALGMRKFRRINGKVTPAKYHLANLVDLYFHEHLEKEDTWRLKYGLLEDVPLEEWPEDATSYAVEDAVWHYKLFNIQSQFMKDDFGGDLPNEVEQQQAAWALHLMSMWGIRADEKAVDYFIGRCVSEIAKMHHHLSDCLRCGTPQKDHDGIKCPTNVRRLGSTANEPMEFKNTGIFKPDGSRTMAEIRRRVTESMARQGLPVPMTDPSTRFPEGQVQTDKDALVATDDPHLHILSESMVFAKHMGQWGPVLRAAVKRPVCCRYDALGAETGRTSASGSEGQEGTNIQNPPRRGDVRPCIIPRDGWVFCSTDADTIELRAHAQNLLEMVGWSHMADYLVKQHKEKGPDLHVVLAARILGIEPIEAQRRLLAGDKEIKDARQFAKIPNFGFPGGLGAQTFVGYAAGQLDREDFMKWFGSDREVAVARAQRLRNLWFETFPENRQYFQLVGDMLDESDSITQLMSGRIRGGVRFTAAANGFFQGRVADAMKEVLFRLAWECYDKSKKSVLYGSRPAMFLHDEPIVEHPEASASERAERQRIIVVETLNKWMPDIPCTSSAVLSRQWFKGAEPLRVDGRLVPVRPEEFMGLDGKKKIRWAADRAA